MKEKLARTASAIYSFLLVATLFVADRLIDHILKTRMSERAYPKTKRVRFSPELRRAIRWRQDSLCMYCGVELYSENMHIDHIYPVEHGGGNDHQNLQALCASCNTRKGVQTDDEFRERYRELLPQTRMDRVPKPPDYQIPQCAFREITQRTSQSYNTQARRRAVFKTPRQKIIDGSISMGAYLGAIWLFIFLAALFVFGAESIFWYVIALCSAIGAGVFMAIGLISRGECTGRMEE